MTTKLAVVMDPITHIHPEKDTTLAIMRAAQARGWSITVFLPNQLYAQDGKVYGIGEHLRVSDNNTHYYTSLGAFEGPLIHFNYILMRKDPPFDLDYIFCTYLLELAQTQGCRVINNPSSLRNINEKMALTQFPELAPDTLISATSQIIEKFILAQQDVVLKPLDSMGGNGILRLKTGDPNIRSAISLLSHNGKRQIMVQGYLPAVTEGDKRILMVHGEAIPYALLRVPQRGELRANLAAGGRGEVIPLSEHDKHICKTVSPWLIKHGLSFVGLDVIGHHLTEINITSPTCLVEIEKVAQFGIADRFLGGLL